MAWVITCPNCGDFGNADHFDMSIADECFCPACEASFEVDFADEEDEESPNAD